MLPGFHPDPSVCRVGTDFYLVTSTFEWFPGLPVWHSRDLVHWRPIGHVLDRPEQLPLDGVRPSGGLYAPTIRWHAGRYYVVCTLVDGPPGRSGSFLVTATNPAGPWSQPVLLEGPGGFDPSLFFDTDGSAWYCATRPLSRPDPGGRTEIYLRELDLATHTLTGPEHVLWHGALVDAVWSEGPHLYRVDGRYYLLTSEGGTEHNHAVTVARGDRITGPYQGNPANPSLTHRQLGRGRPVVGVGHADLVRTAHNEWWAVLLGTRPDAEGRHNLGRETFLAPVRWEDGWPVFCAGVGQVLLDQPTAPALDPHPWPPTPVRDDFTGDRLGPEWNVLRTPRETWWDLSARPGHLRLHLRPDPVGERTQPSLVARRQQHWSFRAATALDFTPAGPAECAGLVLLQNDAHQLRFLVHGSDSGAHRELRAVRRAGGVDEPVAVVALPPGPVELGVRAGGQDYRFGYRLGAGSWQHVTTMDGSVLSTQVAGGFTGAFLGLYAATTDDGRPSRSVADVDWFDYEPVDVD